MADGEGGNAFVKFLRSVDEPQQFAHPAVVRRGRGRPLVVPQDRATEVRAAILMENPRKPGVVRQVVSVVRQHVEALVVETVDGASVEGRRVAGATIEGVGKELTRAAEYAGRVVTRRRLVARSPEYAAYAAHMDRQEERQNQQGD